MVIDHPSSEQLILTEIFIGVNIDGLYLVDIVFIGINKDGLYSLDNTKSLSHFQYSHHRQN